MTAAWLEAGTTPLDTMQNPFLQKTLGALAVRDSGDRYGGELNAAVGGCGLIKSMDDCHFVDDTSASDPASWILDKSRSTSSFVHIRKYLVLP